MGEAVLDLENEVYVDTLTTTPVILKGELHKDYIILRRATVSNDMKIRHVGTFVGAGTVSLGASDAGVNCIVPDTPYNRRQLEISSGADWVYTTAFATGTIIEIVIPIRNIVCTGVWLASSGNIDWNTGLECAGTGSLKVHAQSGRSIGKPLCKVTDGTGDQVIPWVFYASSVNEVVKA